jgi:tetratricopeptide (TPR) repeat protein
MSKWFIAVAFAGVVCANDPRASFDRIKSEAMAAVEAHDWATAEARYEKLLALAPVAHLSASEMYVEVASPLAGVYKQLENTDKLEKLYQDRMEHSGKGLDRGLSQADLGFFYQSGDFASADRDYGERLVVDALKTFEQCAGSTEDQQCRRRLADTAGIQGAIFFQNLDYKRAEPLFRRVIATAGNTAQEEVTLVSLHALRAILVLRKEFEEARQLELRAAAFEAAHPGALVRLKQEGNRTRSR